ncbi:hypothetical protein BS78_01G320000 [Paspalum vaginatum]|nr:hypothetical protein BS78_01G320000 [Paspalum vaginatum]
METIRAKGLEPVTPGKRVVGFDADGDNGGRDRRGGKGEQPATGLHRPRLGGAGTVAGPPRVVQGPPPPQPLLVPVVTQHTRTAVAAVRAEAVKSAGGGARQHQAEAVKAEMVEHRGRAGCGEARRRRRRGRVRAGMRARRRWGQVGAEGVTAPGTGRGGAKPRARGATERQGGAGWPERSGPRRWRRTRTADAEERADEMGDGSEARRYMN